MAKSAKKVDHTEIFKSEADQHWYWHLEAANGEILCASEGYASKQMCMQGLEKSKNAFVKIALDAC